jgi:UDP-N-acetylmuramate--alanine ligase
MMDINSMKRVYFLGIGGIGMSAIARYFKAAGASVSGYDKTQTELTDGLVADNIPVHFQEDISAIPDCIDLVVYTPAVPTDHKEYQYFIKNKVPVLKRSEVLGLLTENLFTIAVSGTHGKTSITSMTAHILKTTGRNINAFIGGISANFNTNLVLSKDATMVVVEADEFDRSFLRLSPDIAVISAIDADHLDIYGSYEKLEESFHLFVEKIKPGGTLIFNSKLNIPISKSISKVSYGIKDADYYAENIRVENGCFIFNVLGPGIEIKDIALGTPGRHNIENALAASTVCLKLGVDKKTIAEALQSYRGVKRRFEFRIRENNLVYIDDYAHHPEEIKACIQAARELFPRKKITGVFQPHLFTRTRDFADGFAKALEGLDALVLMPIYPARELPIPGIDSEFLFSKIGLKEKFISEKDHLLETVAGIDSDIYITMGAGDIDQWVAPIEKLLRNKINTAEK